MSLRTVTSGFLSLSPRVWIDDDVLYARTSLLVQCLCLFAIWRRVRVDQRQAAVEIVGRRLWLWPYQRRVPFDQILRIRYDYSGIPTGFSWFHGRTDEIDIFKVGLETTDRRDIHLFRFIGEGAVETGWSGTLFGGDSAFDLRGSQEDESRRFVDLLKQATGKPLLA